MEKRSFDLLLSIVAALALALPIIVIALLVRLTSPGPALYWSDRVGKGNRVFRMPKFRSMRVGTPVVATHLLQDPKAHLTPIGSFLRKSSLDELPQLWNILKGEMSFVGPRPEVERYVRLYTPYQRQVLLVRPGITDYASIAYRNENDLLAGAEDPEKMYIEQIMPDKIELNMKYLREISPLADIKLILKTVAAVVKG